MRILNFIYLFSSFLLFTTCNNRNVVKNSEDYDQVINNKKQNLIDKFENEKIKNEKKI